MHQRWVGRQLREQDDSDSNLDYQFEPVWKFGTGSIRHTLLTGFEYQHQTIDTQRSTADLPNIAERLCAGSSRIVRRRPGVPVRRQAFLRQ